MPGRVATSLDARRGDPRRWHYVGLTGDGLPAAVSVFYATFPSLWKQPLDGGSDGAASLAPLAPLLWLRVALAASS